MAKVDEISGVMQDFPAHIMDELLDGNSVRLNGLGTFKLPVSGKAKADVKVVSSAGCTVNPDAELTAGLNAEREFRFVTNPTEEGQQNAEGDDTPTPTLDPILGPDEG